MWVENTTSSKAAVCCHENCEFAGWQEEWCWFFKLWVCRSEVGILVHTALLSCSVRHIRSPALLEELVQFLLGNDTHCEQQQDTHTHILRYRLIEHCNHISDEVTRLKNSYIFTLGSITLLQRVFCPVRSVLQHCVSSRSFYRSPAGASWPIWCCVILRSAATGCPDQGPRTRDMQSRVMFWKSLSEQRDWTQLLLLLIVAYHLLLTLFLYQGAGRGSIFHRHVWRQWVQWPRASSVSAQC